MEKKSWKERCDKLQTMKKEVEIEKIVKHVGPIWGSHEAAKKVKKFMTENNMHGQRWCWSGAWNSENGTSYAEFWRLKAKHWAWNFSCLIHSRPPIRYRKKIRNFWKFLLPSGAHSSDSNESMAKNLFQWDYIWTIFLESRILKFPINFRFFLQSIRNFTIPYISCV